MRVRVTVFLRPGTVKLLLARKGRTWGGQRFLAEQMGLSESHLSNLLAGRMPLPDKHQTFLVAFFRGMSHKKGGRLTWDDLFQTAMREMTGASL